MNAVHNYLRMESTVRSRRTSTGEAARARALTRGPLGSRRSRLADPYGGHPEWFRDDRTEA
jgi:hypothetical protein